MAEKWQKDPIRVAEQENLLIIAPETPIIPIGKNSRMSCDTLPQVLGIVSELRLAGRARMVSGSKQCTLCGWDWGRIGNLGVGPPPTDTPVKYFLEHPGSGAVFAPSDGQLWQCARGFPAKCERRDSRLSRACTTGTRARVLPGPAIRSANVA